jgi:histone deacetylase 6
MESKKVILMQKEINKHKYTIRPSPCGPPSNSSNPYEKKVAPLPEKVANLKTGVIYDNRTEKHQPFSHRYGMLCHVENPQRTINIMNNFNQNQLLESGVEYIPKVELLNLEKAHRVHGEYYTEILETIWPEGLERPQMKYKDTYYTKHSFEATRLSAESARLAVEKVVKGDWKNAFALCRPPGHHAQKDNRMHGFCFMNNAVIGAREAINDLGLKKVLILDWDVHHGDSTQHLTYKDSDILYMSFHRFDNGVFFPGPTGAVDNLGEGEGEGFNLNFPFNIDFEKDRVIDDHMYVYAFERGFWPVISEFQPELIIISCGFDCICGDPLGQINLNGDSKYILNNSLSTLS